MAEHTGEIEPVYHHVGTGVTTSTHWCSTCEGFYGVPHDRHDHNHRYFQGHCACAPWQKAQGIYPKQGVFMEHEQYLLERLDGIVHIGRKEHSC